MLRSVTRNAKSIAIGAIVSVVSIGGTAVAAATYDAANADKVDGKHAVHAGATVNKRKGKLVATSSTTGRLPNDIIRRAPNAHKVDGLHAVGAGASIDSRGGKLVATSPKTGRLPNNIIAKAPNANKLDGLDSKAFARVNGFYTAGDFVAGTETEPGNGDWVGEFACGAGDIAIAASFVEELSQDVWAAFPDGGSAVVGWTDADATTSSGSSLTIVATCLDTNGDGFGSMSSQSVDPGTRLRTDRWSR